MQKKSLPSLLLIILFSITKSIAQPTPTFGDWGKVSIEELKMTECSFEKRADALLLIDLAHVYFSKNTTFTGTNFLVTTAYYQRYKIFTEKGLRRASFRHNLTLRNKDQLTNIHAVSYNLVNGIMTKTDLKPEDVHTTKLNEYQDQVSFSIPDVKPGSVFEVRYELEQIVNYNLPGWQFNGDIPSVVSSITVDFLDALEYMVDKHIPVGTLDEKSVPYTSDIELPKTTFTSQILTGNSITYTTHNLPSYHVEPYTNSSRNYTDWIRFQLMGFKKPLNENSTIINTFSSLAQKTLENAAFDLNLRGSGIPKKEWKPLITSNMNDEEKAKAIFEFIRSSLKWNGYNGYIPKDLNSKIWKNKTGSRAEINILLINALRDAGLKVYPILTVSRSAGYTNKSYPILDQYTGVDAFLILNDKNLILDATVKYLPFGAPSFDQLNTYGLVLRGGSDGFSWYAIKDEVGNKELISVNGEMDENGHITGEISMVDNSYVAHGLINMKSNNKESALSDWLKLRIPTATIESVSDSMDVSQCKFLHKVKFSAQMPTDNDGNLYLSVPSIYGSTTNTFVNQDRVSDIDMGYKSRSDIIVQIKVPESYMLDSMIPSSSLIMQDSSISFISDAELLSGTIIIRQRLDYLRSFYPVDIYPAVYDFFQKYYALKQRPVILKKKT